jgi:hypothetical protein
MLCHRRGYPSSKSGILAGAAFACALILGAAPAAAQFTLLSLSGNAITFPAPASADYAAGWINSATGVTFTVDAFTGPTHTTIIAIRATSASLGGSKVIGDLQWRRSDLVAWNSITTTNVQVEQRSQVLNGANDPWSNTIFFRILLNWATDPPATYSANYAITITQTVP